MLKAAGVLAPPQTYTVDGITLTGDPSNALKIGSSSLMPGSPPLTISGHTLSLASAGLLVVDGHTSDLTSHILLSVPPIKNNHHTYILDGITLTGDPTSLLVVVGSTKTLTPGSPPLTLSGHLFALQSGGILVVGDESRGLMSSPPIAAVQTTFTISGLVLTRYVNGVIVVGSTTLSLGSTPVTISGHAVSMVSRDGATVVVVDGYTSTLVPSASSSGVAGAMSSGLGNNNNAVNVFAGGASRHKCANGMVRTVALLLLLLLSQVMWVSSRLVF